MSIDTEMIGQVVSEMMLMLPDETDGEIVAVGLVVIADEGEGTFTRIKASTDRFHEQVGIFRAACHLIEHGGNADE